METQHNQRWSARALLADRSWRIPVPPVVVDEFRRRVGDQDLEHFEWQPQSMPRLTRFAHVLRRRLLLGSGIVWVRGLRSQLADAEQQKIFYLGLGCAMGSPLTSYGRLYAVRDRGQDHRRTAIPVSQTSATTGFHTDSSNKDVLPDLIGLLCEKPAIRGGESLVSNALFAFDRLQKQAPHALEVLSTPLLRDLVAPGTDRSEAARLANEIPVFATSERPEGVTFRYMRYWIERGHERVGKTLRQQVVEALDRLDALLADDDAVVRFRLEAGDILWVNNRTIAHNRTAYRSAPGAPRILHRMWLACGRANSGWSASPPTGSIPRRSGVPSRGPARAGMRERSV